eukprot:CAMPEP_0168744346 /NCGR_PEP_ID=MMETSP0724-20121128/14044_1 /TAXON_ID=265536 /ORGANISM="Amphiprora sp., Strain CCMP467" /LENGTH=372 /DNA_ID=CAMNT_0008792003 /DNA_START=175 /DNA_END=1290 /DNA_ORIENTATION=-
MTDSSLLYPPNDSVHTATTTTLTRLDKLEFVGGPIPFCTVTAIPQYCVYGHGPYLRVASIHTVETPTETTTTHPARRPNNCDPKFRVLEGQTVHGMDWVPLSSSSSSSKTAATTTTTTTTTILSPTTISSSRSHQEVTLAAVVFGGRQAAVVLMEYHGDDHDTNHDNGNSSSLPPPPPPTLQRVPILSSHNNSNNNNHNGTTPTNQSPPPPPHYPKNVLEFADWVWDCRLVRRTHQYSGARRSILYSLCFWKPPPPPRQHQRRQQGAKNSGSIQVAVGTVTNEILLWSLADGPFNNNDMTAIDNIVNNKTTTIVTESHVLQGHQGVIHAVQFNHDGTQLASASDDRSIRLWGQQRRQQQQQQQEEENNDNHP